MTPTERDALCKEALDGKVPVYCGDHMYFGPGQGNKARPAGHCSKCWLVFYLHHFSTVPPENRAEQIDELRTILHHVTEQVERGTFDYTPFRHAEVTVEKDAE